MRLVELDPHAEPYWEELLAGEQEPWGGSGEQLTWRDKTRNIGLRDDDGRLLAAGGAVLAELHTAANQRFAVVGLGGLVVRASARGQGLARRLATDLLELARGFPAERAMLFCKPELTALYSDFGFREIADPVWVRAGERACADAAERDVEPTVGGGRLATRRAVPRRRAVLAGHPTRARFPLPAWRSDRTSRDRGLVEVRVQRLARTRASAIVPAGVHARGRAGGGGLGLRALVLAGARAVPGFVAELVDHLQEGVHDAGVEVTCRACGRSP